MYVSTLAKIFVNQKRINVYEPTINMAARDSFE